MTMEHATPSNDTSSQATETTSQASQATSESSFAIPEAYADSAWTEKVKSTDDLWKTTANLQEMIGKRPAGIPTSDASDADWDTFYKAAGRPDEAKYEFTDIEGLPEGFDSEGYKATAAAILHGAGLSQKQADQVYQAFMANELKSSGEQTEKTAGEQKELDERFDALTKEHFDGNYEAAEKSAMEAFQHYTPQSLKDSLGALENHPEALAAVVATINGIKGEADKVRKEYGAEGSITTGTQAVSMGIDSVRSELSDLRTSEAARNFQHPDYKATMEKISNLSATVSKHYTK